MAPSLQETKNIFLCPFSSSVYLHFSCQLEREEYIYKKTTFWQITGKERRWKSWQSAPFPPTVCRPFFPPPLQEEHWWMLKIFQCLCLNCLLCSAALTTLSNGLCIGGTYTSCSIQEYWTWPCLSQRQLCWKKEATGMRRSLCPSAHRTFSILHTPLRWPSPLLFTKHSTAQSLHSLNHRLHLLGVGLG